MKNLILVLLILSSFSCANTKNGNSNQDSTTKLKQSTPMNYKELAKQKFQITDKTEQVFECIENEDKTFSLCKVIKQGTTMQPRNSIQFAVYDMKTNEMIYEGGVDGGSVEWYDNQRLEIYQQQGIPMEGMTRDDMIQIYDVVEKTQKRKSEVEKK